MARLDDREDQRASIRAVTCFDSGTRDADELRGALAGLADPTVLGTVTDELLGFDDDPDLVEEVAAFAERLLAAARRPREVGPARWLAAVAAERSEDPLAAEEHLRRAVAADPRWGPAVDRLAWCLFDRGDAPEALSLWRSIGATPENSEDVATAEPFAHPPGRRLARNDPCWCGSGRKYKACHLDRPVEAPLPDRISWLCRKATAYVERRGGGVGVDAFDLAQALADLDDTGAVDPAFGSSLVVDLTLHELGWFDQFLAERGPLLPEDEAFLAEAWTLVDRTVHEVVEVDPGRGLVVTDLRTDEQIGVRERTFSLDARPGMLVCGRAVPDGETHQFLGGLFAVPPGREAELLDLLDEADPFGIARYVGALHRPPTLVTREGEPLMACTAEVQVPDPAAARAVLDPRYEQHGDTWSEVHQLEGSDNLIRATLRLDADRISVETMSETRMDRVLAVLLGEIEGARVVRDERRPLTVPAQPAPAEAGPGLEDPGLFAAAEAWIEESERRWCDEEVPALAGLTPRQAAADPTRRESLERLLASFDEHNARAGGGPRTMRPDRLRELLGLDRRQR